MPDNDNVLQVFTLIEPNFCLGNGKRVLGHGYALLLLRLN